MRHFSANIYADILKWGLELGDFTKMSIDVGKDSMLAKMRSLDQQGIDDAQPIKQADTYLR